MYVITDRHTPLKLQVKSFTCEGKNKQPESSLKRNQARITELHIGRGNVASHTQMFHMTDGDTEDRGQS